MKQNNRFHTEESDSMKEKKRSWEAREKEKRVREEKIIEIKREKECNPPKLIKFPEFRLFCPALTSRMNQ